MQINESFLPSDELYSYVAKHYRLSLEDCKLFMKISDSSQPWEKSFLFRLLEERSEAINAQERTRSLLRFHQELPSSSFIDSEEQITSLPKDFTVYKKASGLYNLLTNSGNTEMNCGDYSTYEEALAMALKMDRELNPLLWRPYAQTCPPNQMLLFACADGTWSKEVPVKTGYREANSYEIFGASWKPTHWCYQPDANSLSNK